MCPIKGLTDRVQAAFPTLGKLRKGGEAKRNAAGQVVQMGPDLHHFRFTSDRPEVVEAFEAAYGTAPALIYCFLPHAEVEANFSCWKEAYTAGGLVHRCDGETMSIWRDERGQMQRTPKACDGGCDEVGRLAVIIPELVQAGLVGYVTLETHGIHDLLSIQASLMAAAESRVGNPLGLRGIQWVLRRQPEKVSTPMGNGKRARREKWLVKLEPAAAWVQLQLATAHAETMMLPAPRGDAGRVVDVESGEIYGDDNAVVEGEPPTDAEAEWEEMPAEEEDAIETAPEEVSKYQVWRKRLVGSKTNDERKGIANELAPKREEFTEQEWADLRAVNEAKKAELSAAS